MEITITLNFLLKFIVFSAVILLCLGLGYFAGKDDKD